METLKVAKIREGQSIVTIGTMVYSEHQTMFVHYKDDGTNKKAEHVDSFIFRSMNDFKNDRDILESMLEADR